MGDFTRREMEEAGKAIAVMIGRSEKAREKFAPGSSQHTLQKNRIAALEKALSLIDEEISADIPAASYEKEDCEKAIAPIISPISKSEKAQGKLAEGTWQHRMLRENLKALRIALPLIKRKTQ